MGIVDAFYQQTIQARALAGIVSAIDCKQKIGVNGKHLVVLVHCQLPLLVALGLGVVVIAALAGGTLLGILGALIAIPVAASILIIIDQVVVPKQEAA